MIKYRVVFTDTALKDLDKFRKSNPRLLGKVDELTNDIMMHPRSGLGHPEALVGEGGDVYSRRISGKNRIVYEIREEDVCVFVISLEGHYNDK